MLTYAVFAMLLNSVGTVILQSIHTLGVATDSAKFLEAFKDLPIAIVSFLVASLLPRLGYRRSMMLGLGLVAVACVAMPLMKSFWTTKVLFATVGCSFALVKVSVYSSIGLVTTDRQAHASLTNMIEGVFMVGVLSSYWLFSAFIDPADPASTNWMHVYWVLAATCVATIALLATSPLDESEARLEHDTPGAAVAAMFTLLARPLVYLFILSAFLYVLIEQSIGTWLPTFNSEILKLPNAMSVQAASIYAAALALGRLAAGFVLHRVSWYALLNVCVIAMGALVLLTLPLAAGVVHDPNIGWLRAPVAAFLFPLIGFFMGPIYPALNSVMLSALPKNRHAAMTGLIVVFSALGGTTGSMITGFAFGRIGGAGAFYLSLVPMAAIVVSLFLFKRHNERVVAIA